MSAHSLQQFKADQFGLKFWYVTPIIVFHFKVLVNAGDKDKTDRD